MSRLSRRSILKAAVFGAVAAILGPSSGTLPALRAGVDPRGGRAAGGPVIAGTNYTIGERGPERFIAPIGGFIYAIDNGAGKTQLIFRSGASRTVIATEP